MRYNVYVGDRRGKYEWDAPWALTGLILGTILLLALAAVAFANEILAAGVAFLAGAVYTLASVASHLYTTRRGRFAVWRAELDRLEGGEDVLDLGCGRGAVLLLAAARLTTGRATGVDRWRGTDAATRANAEAEGVSDRVDLVSADLTELPFDDERFDVVVSALALHRLRGAREREQALSEAFRVLRPGGLLLIADVEHTHAYEAVLRKLGARDVHGRELGWRYWHGGPWGRTRMVEVHKV